MNTPSRTSLRITAYHMVVASPVPWIRCQGFGRRVLGVVTPAFHELALGRHLTRGGVDEEHGHAGR